MRPLLLGAAGGALAALLVVGLFRPGAPSGSGAPAAQNDGKVATALEEIEKDRSAISERNSAVEKIATDLGARLAALEQKAATGVANVPEGSSDRLKALEQKLATIETRPTSAATARDEATIAGLTQRIASLEQRVTNGNLPRATNPGTGNAGAVGPGVANSRAMDPTAPGASTRQPAPPETTSPEAGPQGLRPPGLIPEPERPRPTTPVRGWVLHNVYGGVAVLESRTAGIVEVRRGQNVQGLGRIAAIERRGDRWVVTTDRGVISSYGD